MSRTPSSGIAAESATLNRQPNTKMPNFCCNVAFVSWHKHWKGIYLHFIPRYCVRIFLWGVDWHRKNPLIHSPNAEVRHGAKDADLD